MRVNNPIIPGFHPDPSVCVVGSDAYLVTSSFEYFPGVPIFHSRDLVHWRQIGHCLTRPSQLPLDRIACSDGIYAPALRHHDGVFYMVTTNVRGGGNFYVTARDPRGPWSEPIWVDDDWFDPSLLFDDDGRVYYTRRVSGGIGQAEIDIATGKFKSDFRLISPGLCSPDAEGPHLYKMLGRYYLMMAEGGTRFGHSETICRCSSPWGPFEPCPHNPILTHRHLSGHPIRDTGHAELFQAPDGSWWLVALATRQPHYDSATLLGRETFLAPVRIDSEGWPVVGTPVIGHSGTLSRDFDGPAMPAQPWPGEPTRDDFDAPTLALVWNFLRNPRECDWSLDARPGHLRLNGSAATLDDVDSPAFIGRRQCHFEFAATALLEFEPSSDNEEAGLTLLMNNSHHYDVCVTRRDGRREILLRRQVGDLTAIAARALAPDGRVRLQVQGDDRLIYSVRYGAESGELTTLAQADGRYISSENARTWTGIYVGMFASGRGKPCRRPADFDWFEYSPLG